MIDLLGIFIPVPPEFSKFITPIFVFFLNLVSWFLLALLVNLFLMRLLKFATRKLPGDLEDILLGILRRPIVILLIVFGSYTSLRFLSISPGGQDIYRRIFLTFLVLILAHILGRLIRDVVVYYGEKWAQKTESQVDDVVIPIINLFGPILLVLAAALIILPLWGINVTSVLMGAGVLGIVLGLALQETLGNIFSGLSLLMEASFKRDDLIQFPDGRVCEVQKLGLRSTKLFSLDDQATIFVPNKTLATTMLVNLTKPTSEQKFCIEVSVGANCDLSLVKKILDQTANGHPAVLSSKLAQKSNIVLDQVNHIRKVAQSNESDPTIVQTLQEEANKNEKTIPRLQLEGKQNDELQILKERLRELIRGIKNLEKQGLTEMERQELYCKYVAPISDSIQLVSESTHNYSDALDGWLTQEDFWNLKKTWQRREEQLQVHWQQLKKAIQTPDDRTEMRLDDFCSGMIDWLEREFKIVPGYWKDPEVSIKEFDHTQTHLQLWFYVDNIRLERDGRARRVRSEISRIIREKLIEANTWC
jgi:small-conductance mechanosensitive channel